MLFVYVNKIFSKIRMNQKDEVSWAAQKALEPVIRNPLNDPNPFAFPKSTNIYEMKQNVEKAKKATFKQKKKMTIAQRAIPERPLSSRRNIKKNYELKMNIDDYLNTEVVKPVIEKRQIRQNTANLMEEKREIFLSNLLIARHEQELDRIQNQKDAIESKCDAMEVDIKEQQNISKTSTSQNENTRNRFQKRYEESLKKRIEVFGQVKKKRQLLTNMENEISKLEETFTQYKAYDEILQDISIVHGQRPKTPDELLDFFEHLENDDLFIVKNVDSIRSRVEDTEADIDNQMVIIKKTIEDVEDQIKQLQNEKEREQQEEHQFDSKTDQFEVQINKLQRQIANIFKQCFKSNGFDQSTVIGQNSLTMLSMIEGKIEAMTRIVKRFDPSFVSKKLKVINERKRKEQREANQRKKELEQKRKIQQMKERATKPVKKKEGRPLYGKVMIMKVQRVDPELKLRELEEKARIENLLYGDLYD